MTTYHPNQTSHRAARHAAAVFLGGLLFILFAAVTG